MNAYKIQNFDKDCRANDETFLARMTISLNVDIKG